MRIRISTIPLTSGLGARSSKLGVRRLLCETLSALAANLHRSSTARALLLRRNPGTQCIALSAGIASRATAAASSRTARIRGRTDWPRRRNKPSVTPLSELQVESTERIYAPPVIVSSVFCFWTSLRAKDARPRMGRAGLVLALAGLCLLCTVLPL